MYHHYNTSNDLEVYTIDTPDNERLEEVCNMKQPFVFKLNNEELMGMFNLNFLMTKFGNFDINIRNVNNFDDESQMYLPLSLEKSQVLFEKDGKSIFITERNGEFISETGLEKYLTQNDEFMKPPLVSNSYYDFTCGSKNTVTPLRYNINYRNYIYVTNGTLNLKLICPNDSKYLQQVKDFEIFEFRSPINVWNVQEDYKKTFGRVRVLDIKLEKGTMLYLPPFWWYSVKFDKNSSYLNFNYRTYMSTMSILPSLALHFLQRQNIKHKSIKKFKLEEENVEEIILEELQEPIEEVKEPIEEAKEPIEEAKEEVKEEVKEEAKKESKKESKKNLNNID
jgi:hypothetical protein